MTNDYAAGIEAAAKVVEDRARSYSPISAVSLLNGARHGEAERIAILIRNLAPTASAPDRAGVDVDRLPDNWAYWLKDAAQILRSNGTTMHADAVDAILAALSTPAEGPGK